MQKKEALLAPLVKAFGLDEACGTLLVENTEINPDGVTDISTLFNLIRKAGQVLDVEEKAADLIEEMEERIDIVIHKLKFIEAAQRPKVLFLSDDFVEQELDTYTRSLVAAAGGSAFRPERGEDSPGVLILCAQEKSIFELLGALPSFLARPEWAQSDAVKNNKVYLVDLQAHLSGNYIQAAQDVELLAEMIYPQYFVFSEPGETWIRFEL